MGEGTWGDSEGAAESFGGPRDHPEPQLFRASVFTCRSWLLILMSQKVSPNILLLGFSKGSDSHAPGDSH